MEMSVYSHKANDRLRKDKISILEQLGICISKDSEIWFSVKCNGYAKYRCIHWMGPFNSTVY